MDYRRNLEKPIYDIHQLKRAIDTNVVELKPEFPIPNKDLVLTSLYNRQLQINEDLNEKLDEVINESEELQQEINNLNAQIEQIGIEIEESINGKTNAESQISTLVSEIVKLETLLSEAIQKALEYGVDKVSIAAQNDTVRVGIEMTEEEIDELKRELDLSESSKLSEILANTKFDTPFDVPDPSEFDIPSTPSASDILAKVRISPNGSLSVSASNNKTRPNIPFTVTIQNNNDTPISISLEHTGITKEWRNWFVISKLTATIPSNGSETMSFLPIPPIITSLNPSNKISFRRSRKYDGELKISVDGQLKSTIPTSIRKSAR